LRLAREQIEEKAQAIELSNRYKSEFLANMSHELRTPLNSILLLSKLLSENREDRLSPDDVESAQAIYSSGSDLLSLINEILDLSKVEAGKMDLKMEKTALVDICDHLRQTFDPVAASKGLAFTINVAPDLPDHLVTDAKRVEQVLKNFLSNAFKFTAEGQVSLELARPTPDPRAGAEGLEPDRSIAFAVVDTGFGIPPEKQQLIFEAFQQADGSTSRQFGGTGLGLSISRELAGLLGGTIVMQSTPGSGSRFALLLPERPLDSSGVPDSPAGAPPPPQKAGDAAQLLSDHKPPPKRPTTVSDDRRDLEPGDKRLLIVEDDPGFQKVLRDLAHEQGFKCLIADTGETGLQFAECFAPSAIVLDIRLPGINGWTVMTRLKENMATRHIPVHVISASERQMDALRMGAVDFVTKPVTPDTLAAVFDTLDRVISKTVKQLLIVEDDNVQQQAIARLIRHDDVRIDFAASGGQALEMVTSGQYDCMILDLGLPDMTGLDLLGRIKLEDGAGGACRWSSTPAGS
jgi:CheY-like chemotaxis protein/nitrogen-specific signal transduction histidine kinase